MSMSTNYHINLKNGDSVEVTSQNMPGLNTGLLKFRDRNGNMLNLFMDSVETIERVAFELNSLAMEIREYGWAESQITKENDK